MNSHNEAEAPGYVDGLHYTEHVETVKVLKRADDLAKAEALLVRLIEATETESRSEGFGVAPWYYEQLAIVRAKRGDVAGEVEVLERYASQHHAPGVKPAKLMARLEKAKQKQGGA